MKALKEKIQALFKSKDPLAQGQSIFSKENIQLMIARAKLENVRYTALTMLILSWIFILISIWFGIHAYFKYIWLSEKSNSLLSLQQYASSITWLPGDKSTVKDLLQDLSVIQDQKKVFEQKFSDYQASYTYFVANLLLPSLNIWKDPYTSDIDTTLVWQKFLQQNAFVDTNLFKRWSDLFKDSNGNISNELTDLKISPIKDLWNGYFSIDLSVDFTSPTRRSFLVLINKLSQSSNKANITLINMFMNDVWSEMKNAYEQAILLPLIYQNPSVLAILKNDPTFSTLNTKNAAMYFVASKWNGSRYMSQPFLDKLVKNYEITQTDLNWVDVRKLATSEPALELLQQSAFSDNLAAQKGIVTQLRKLLETNESKVYEAMKANTLNAQWFATAFESVLNSTWTAIEQTYTSLDPELIKYGVSLVQRYNTWADLSQLQQIFTSMQVKPSVREYIVFLYTLSDVVYYLENPNSYLGNFMTHRYKSYYASRQWMPFAASRTFAIDWLFTNQLITYAIYRSGACDYQPKDPAKCYYDFRSKFEFIPLLSYAITSNTQLDKISALFNFLYNLPPLADIENFNFKKDETQETGLTNDGYVWQISITVYGRSVTAQDSVEIWKFLSNRCFATQTPLTLPMAISNLQQKLLDVSRLDSSSKNIQLSANLNQLLGLLNEEKAEYDKADNYQKTLKHFEIYRMFNENNLCK